jgi:hypothetical protein
LAVAFAYEQQSVRVGEVGRSDGIHFQYEHRGATRRREISAWKGMAAAEAIGITAGRWSLHGKTALVTGGTRGIGYFSVRLS